MSRIMNWLLRIYPQAWRDRYEDEFRAMLEQCDLTFWDMVDIFFGGLDARFIHRPQSTKSIVEPQGGNTVALSINKQAHLNKPLFTIAGYGAFISALTLLSGIVFAFFGLEEDATEFLIIIAPISLLPSVIALHRVFHPFQIRFSRFTFYLGIVGFVTFTLTSFISTILSIVSPDTTLPTPVSFFFWIVIALTGIWMLLIGWMALYAPSPMGEFGGISILTGMSWIIGIFFGSLVGSINPELTQSLGWLFSLNILLLIVLYQIFAVYLGALFLSGTFTRYMTGDLPLTT